MRFSESTSPRTLEFLGKAIKGLQDYDLIEAYAKAFLREDDAIEFVEFVKNYDLLKDLDKYIENPDLMEKIRDEEKKIILVIKMAKRVADKGDIKVLERILDYLMNRGSIKELAAAFLKLVKLYNKKLLSNAIETSPVVVKAIEELVE